jgi:hypothetical protein
VSANRMTLNERLMYSTVRIHGRGEAGEEVGGTGFFVSHPCASGVRVRMLVTLPDRALRR